MKNVVQETLNIISNGGYGTVSFKEGLQRSVNGTICIAPEESNSWLYQPKKTESSKPLEIEVTRESTQEAVKRLYLEENLQDLVLLNFASAKNRGGGFLRGARAQEEAICRASTLFACLASKTVDPYYERNAACKHLIYTDYMIYSPSVIFFRSSNDFGIDETPSISAVITCPAPNAEAKKRPPPQGLTLKYNEHLERRAAKVLACCEKMGHKNLILGAWGCGVFGNSFEDVSNAFAKALFSDRFSGSFERVIFAIYDRSDEGRKVFRRTFGLSDNDTFETQKEKSETEEMEE